MAPLTWLLPVAPSVRVNTGFGPRLSMSTDRLCLVRPNGAGIRRYAAALDHVCSDETHGLNVV